MDARGRLLALLAAIAGALIAYVDSRPTWDDTGISAAVLLVSAACLGALDPRRAWLWALLVGAWIPVIGIATRQNVASLLALLIALIGSYAGALGHWVWWTLPGNSRS